MPSPVGYAQRRGATEYGLHLRRVQTRPRSPADDGRKQMSKRDLSREWDFDLPRNNLFEDWPLDKKVSISPELEQQIAGNPKSQKENDIAKPSSKYRRTPMPKTKQGEHTPGPWIASEHYITTKAGSPPKCIAVAP